MKRIAASLLMTQTTYILMKRIKSFFVCVGGGGGLTKIAKYAFQCGDHLVYHNLKT